MGRWQRDRIAIVGDYGPGGDQVHSWCAEGVFRDITADVIAALTEEGYSPAPRLARGESNDHRIRSCRLARRPSSQLTRAHLAAFSVLDLAVQNEASSAVSARVRTAPGAPKRGPSGAGAWARGGLTLRRTDLFSGRTLVVRTPCPSSTHGADDPRCDVHDRG
jgi:hypothetical protein